MNVEHITNLGMYGTREFDAIINPSQSSILSVGAAMNEPVVTRTGRIKAATVLHVVLTVDHRPVDGATAAESMAAFVEVVENPLRLLV